MLRLFVCAAILRSISAAQTPAPSPQQFDAASIHPADSKELGGPSGCRTTTGLMRCTNVTLQRCIVGAYRVGPDRVLHGPNWLNTERFDIIARSDQPVGDKGLMAMLETLLADRFKLALHREARTSEAIVLEVGKSGPKLQPAAGAYGSSKNMHDHLEATGITIGQFSEILSRNLNLLVIDHTGLTGAFDITLHWNPDSGENLSHDESVVALRPEVSKAIAQQMGLVLKFRKMPVEILVIDHAEKPSEN